MGTTVVCWNIGRRHNAWRRLVEMDADVALLQEAGRVPADIAARVDIGPDEHWDSHCWNSEWYKGRFSKLYDRWPMVVKLSDRVEVEWLKQVSPITDVDKDEIAVSGIGTIAAARIIPHDAAPFVAVSMYARWMSPHPSTKSRWRVGYPDGSAHRIISDLSAFIGNTDPSTHRILAAGDLNMALSGKDDGDPWLQRERTVTDRMDALGLELLGPNTRTAGKRTRLPNTCRLTPVTCRPITQPAKPPRPPRANSTGPSRHAASTATSPCAPSTKPKNGDQATTAGYSSKSPAISRRH